MAFGAIMGGIGGVGGSTAASGMGSTLASGVGSAATSGSSQGWLSKLIHTPGSIYSSMEQRKARKKAEKASRPERRRMTAMLETLNRYKQQQLAARTSAAAAGFDFADQLRF